MDKITKISLNLKIQEMPPYFQLKPGYNSLNVILWVFFVFFQFSFFIRILFFLIYSLFLFGFSFSLYENVNFKLRVQKWGVDKVSWKLFSETSRG